MLETEHHKKQLSLEQAQEIDIPRLEELRANRNLFVFPPHNAYTWAQILITAHAFHDQGQVTLGQHLMVLTRKMN